MAMVALAASRVVGPGCRQCFELARRVRHRADERSLTDSGVTSVEVNKLHKIHRLGKEIEAIEKELETRRRVREHVDRCYASNPATSTQLLALRRVLEGGGGGGMQERVVAGRSGDDDADSGSNRGSDTGGGGGAASSGSGGGGGGGTLGEQDHTARTLAAIERELEQREHVEQDLAAIYAEGGRWAHLSTSALREALSRARAKIAWLRCRLDLRALDAMLSESLIKLGEQFQDREVSRAEYDMREKELKHLQRELAYLELHGAYWHVRTRHLEPQAALMESGGGGSRGGREQLGVLQWADVRARAVTRMRSLKTKQGWATMAQATKLAVVGLTSQAIRATRSKTSLGKPRYEEGPHGPGRANAGRSYCILLSVVLFCLLLIPSIGWSKANSYLESGVPHTCCVNGACYESPPCNEHAQCVHLESVAGLDVFSSSCHRLLSDLLEAGPDEEVGKLCPCSCSRAHKPVLATLRSSTGLAGSSDNSMLLQFGLCTLSTPRLTVTVYNSDYDDKSEVGSFRAREYLEIFLNGEKVATCDPPSNDCSPFVCLDEVDVSRWTKNGSLHVTMVNSPDVSVGGCDGTGGTGIRSNIW